MIDFRGRPPSDILESSDKIPLIVLAAGGSSRMGSPKQLLPYRGSTLLRHAVDTALASPCRPVIVVLGAAADRAGALLADLPVECAINSEWQRGMGASIRIGLRHILKTQNPAAIMIMLCDQPAVTPEILNKLLNAHQNEASIVASNYDGIAGVPAIIGRHWFGELLTLDDSAGARFLFKNHPQSVSTIRFTQGSIDVDTPADYARLLDEQPENRE